MTLDRLECLSVLAAKILCAPPCHRASVVQRKMTVDS